MQGSTGRKKGIEKGIERSWENYNERVLEQPFTSINRVGKGREGHKTRSYDE